MAKNDIMRQKWSKFSGELLKKRTMVLKELRKSLCEKIFANKVKYKS